MIVLAAAGFVSCARTGLLAEHEAMERAQDLADGSGSGPLAHPDHLSAIRIAHVHHRSCRRGGYSFPRWFRFRLRGLWKAEELTDVQLSQWRSARNAQGEGPDSWRAFLGSNPPSNYVAAAHYAIGLGLLETGQKESAAEHFLAVSRQCPEAIGETGLPLQPLAEFKPLTLAAQGIATGIGMAHFCSNVVYRPTPLTPDSLDAAAELAVAPADRQICERWLETWGNHETARRIAGALQEESNAITSHPPLLWVSLAQRKLGFAS